MEWRLHRTKELLPPQRRLLLESAVARAPDRDDLAIELSATLLELEQYEALVQRLGPVLTRKHPPATLLHHLGRGALALMDYAFAADVLEAAVRGGLNASRGLLALTQWWLGDADPAIANALAALERAPSDNNAIWTIAAALVARGDRERLWDVCRSVRARGGWSAYLPSAMAAAASTDAQHLEVAVLAGPAPWLARCRPAVPRNFNDEMVGYLTTHAAATALPPTKATVGAGQRVDHLEWKTDAIVATFFAHVREVVDAYVVQLELFADHPWQARRPRIAALESWGVTVVGDGHEEWHVHPRGWLSGVYYAAVPDATIAPAHAGAIEIGPFPFDEPSRCSSWPAQTIEPRAGDLVLFPSYMAHRTWPTGAVSPRVCVAFDVIDGSSLPTPR